MCMDGSEAPQGGEGEAKLGGLRSLEERVLNRELCTLCGACASLCPYLVAWKGRIVKLHDCDLAEGRCYSYCPRTEVDLEVLFEKRFGSRDVPVEVGMVRRILVARAREERFREKAQTGGVVSALVCLAMDEGLVDLALLTKKEDDLLAKGRLARTKEEVLECQGSSYVAAPTLSSLNGGNWTGSERLGAVGLPCQVLALAKMSSSSHQRPSPVPEVRMIVGLFCTWALSYEGFRSYLQTRFPGRSVGSIDITPPPERLMVLKTNQGIEKIPVEEIRPFIRPTCSVCADMTSELSDISVGTVEGRPGWNTVVVRTQLGEELMAVAEKKGILDLEEPEKGQLHHLVEASILKKKRALLALREKGEPHEGYLKLPPGWTERLSSGKEEVL